MLKVRTAKTGRGKRELEKRAPKLVETGRKTLILHGTKTSNVVNTVLTQIYSLKKGSAVRYTRKNDGIRPFENGGETLLESYSLKTDCSLFVYGSHAKKRPDNLILGRMYDHHVYDLVEVGVENLKTEESFTYDKKLAPQIGSKPIIAFTGEGFENNQELKHLKEILLELFRGEVVEGLNLVGVDQAYVCTAVSSNRVFFTHCAVRLKKSGTIVPKIELIEVGPSMDLVVRRHRLPNEFLQKEAMRQAPKQHKKEKNVGGDPIKGKIGKIYMPNQQIGEMALPNKAKGVKRERREKRKQENEQNPKRMKEQSS